MKYTVKSGDNRTTTAKSLAISSNIIIILALLMISVSSVASAGDMSMLAHDSNIMLNPAWTFCGANNNFTVNITNDGPDTVNEVRLYSGPYDNITTNFPPHINYVCGPAPSGWLLIDLHPSFPICQYMALNPAVYINGGESKIFTFDATTTTESNYSWAVETRDTADVWHRYYPPTTVDCTPPVTNKTFDGVQTPNDNDAAGVTHWITAGTNILLNAYDPQPHPSGLHSTYKRVTLVDDSYCYDNQETCADAIGGGAHNVTEIVERTNTTSFSKGALLNASADSYVEEQDTDANNGNSGDLKVKFRNENNKRTFIKFDTSSIPNLAGATVTSAKLKLYLTSAPSNTRNHEARRVTSNWNESVNWITQPSTSASVTDTKATGTSDSVLIVWDVTSDVQLFAIGTNNEGWMINDQADDLGILSSTNETKYASSEYETKSKRPILEINYTYDVTTKYNETITTEIPPQDFTLYTGPFQANESCHLVEYYSVDKVGWRENAKRQCVFIDDTKPVVSIETGKPQLTCTEGEGCDYWVMDHVTPITLTCNDMGPHPSGVKSIEYRWSLDGEWPASNSEGNWLTYTEPIIFNEDSVHTLEARCTDMVDHVSDIKTTVYRVDSVAPEINKSMIGVEGSEWIGQCPPREGSDDVCYVKMNDGNVSVNVADPDPTGHGCNVGIRERNCYYEVRWFNTGLPVSPASTVIVDLGYTVVDSGHFTDSTNITFKEDSRHDLYIACSDLLGNLREDTETFYVDGNAPETTKAYGEPFFAAGNLAGNEEGNTYHWITSDTPITFTATDNKVGVDTIHWRATLLNISDEECVAACEEPKNDEVVLTTVDGGEGSGGGSSGGGSLGWNFREGNTATFKIPEQSCHFIEFKSTDKFGHTEKIKDQCVFVDNTAPNGTKTVGQPSVFAGIVSSDSGPEDPIPVGSGSVDPNRVEIKLASGESYVVEKKVTTGDVAAAAPEIYFLVDTTGSMGGVIGNVKTDINTILGSVDARFGAGQYKDFPEDSFAFQNVQSITSTKSDVVSAINSMSSVGGYDTPEGQLYALHKIAQSAAGFSSNATKIVVWFGDAPGHDSVCSAISGEGANITEASVTSELVSAGITVVAISTTTGAADGLDGNPSGGGDYSGYCVIDGTPGQATRISNATGGVHLKDVPASNITAAILNAIGTVTGKTDVVPDASDCTGKGLNLAFNPEQYNDVPGSTTVTFNETITLPADAENTTDITCDVLFRSGALGGTIATERILVNHNGGSVLDWYVNKNTPITLSCDDLMPHPVGNEQVCLKVTYNESSSLTSEYCSTLEGQMNDGYCCVAGGEATFRFKEDSMHNLEYYCKDGLSNSNKVDLEYFAVETVPPVITKTIVGPSSGNCPPPNHADELEPSRVCTDSEGGCHEELPPVGERCYVSDSTTIHVEAIDPEPHPVNNVRCDWSYTVRGEGHNGQTNITAPFDVQFPEESVHDLRIECWDALGNTARDVETYIVDTTDPKTKKDLEGPQYPKNAEHADYPRWINSQTNITFGAYDPEPHPSGVNATYTTVTLVADEYCRNQELCEGYEHDGDSDEDSIDALHRKRKVLESQITIPEESCHMIEYYSVDNVDNTETVKRQCIFVDNTGPTPVKTVGKPSDKWDGMTNGMDSVYYPGIKDLCWNGQNTSIDCWKVTTMTPITMDCSDPEPHPVDHSTLSFKVDFDNGDATPAYCDKLDGSIGENGYCNLKREDPVILLFGEESEHNLKFYCTDALGNQGPLDDEKFKVEGTAFNITINKKWNLISVPFTLLNDSMHKVFDPEADKIKSVWTYDAVSKQWSIYTPDGIDNDNMNSMLPGNGYWVLATNDTNLVIGGSLFSPAKTPASKTIVPGWNLIGYWGTDNMYGNGTVMSYTGPNGNGKTAYCELYSLATSMGDVVFNSLWNYWEPYNPNQWGPYNKYKHMDPGAGYWVFTNQNGEYVVPTDCSADY